MSSTSDTIDTLSQFSMRRLRLPYVDNVEEVRVEFVARFAQMHKRHLEQLVNVAAIIIDI